MTAYMQRELAEALAAIYGAVVDEADNGRAAAALLPTVQALIADAEKGAAAQALRDAERRVRAVYDLQCPVMPPDQYVGAGAAIAHRWWEKVLGGALADLHDRAAALDPSGAADEAARR